MPGRLRLGHANAVLEVRMTGVYVLIARGDVSIVLGDEELIRRAAAAPSPIRVLDVGEEIRKQVDEAMANVIALGVAPPAGWTPEAGGAREGAR